MATNNMTGFPAYATKTTPIGADLIAIADSAAANAPKMVTILSILGVGPAWVDVAGTSQAMAVNRQYISQNGALCTFTLPATAAVGDVMEVQGAGAGGWLIAQGASQQVIIGADASTSGAGGSVASSNRYDGIQLVCITANNIWKARSTIGANLTVV